MKVRLALLLAVLCLPTLASGQEDDAGGISDRHATLQVEEIVVQARKRSEFLEDTPISVTALSENTLREAGVLRMDQIQSLVPNLLFTTADDGLSTDIRIRGIGTPQTVSIAFDPGVGVYVDGVFLPRTIGTLMDVLDIQQIEVLRGPQGTLFGKNTVGGAINITTIKPSPDLEGFALVRPGNFDSVHARGMLNVPFGGALEDIVFARVAFAHTQARGYVYDSFRDEFLSDQNSLSFLGSLRIQPSDDLTMDVSGTWSRQNTKGRGGECVFVQNTSLGSLDPTLYPNCRATGPFENNADAAPLTDLESYGTWGTLTWDAGAFGPLEDVVAKFIGSWRQQKPRLRVDVDMTATPAFVRATAGGPPGNGTPGSQEQISIEGQLNAAAWDGRIHFVTGAFGFWETAEENVGLTILPGFLNIVQDNDRAIDNWTWALFGQATIDLTDWASLTAGARYTQDKKGLFAETRNALDPNEPPLQSENRSAVFDAWTPMASLALTLPEEWLFEVPVDHLMGYFTYSRGFRGGGFNGLLVATNASQFQPEFLDSFEIGMKTIAFDQRATLNISAFYGDYDDIQVTAIRDLGDQNGDGAPEFEQTTLNAAKATTKGAEIELLALPVPGLRANGSVGLLYTEYDSFPNAVSDLDASTIDRSGQSFDNAPELQTHVAVQYSLPVELDGPTWLEGWLTPRLDWSYQSEIHVRGPEVLSGIQRGYNLLHARLSYSFNDDRSQVALWGRNLTDETYFNQLTPIISSFGIAGRFYGAPRTYGAEISHSF